MVGLKSTAIASLTVGILLWLWPTDLQAAVPGIVKAGTTVYSSPDTRTKSVAFISEITRVQVVGKSGKAWFKIEATLKNGKKITGWVEKSQIGRDLSGGAPPSIRTQENTLLKSLIDRRGVAETPPVQRSVESKSSNWVSDRLDLSFDLGYRIDSYSISDGTSSLSYTIPGLLIGTEVNFDFLKSENFPLRLGLRGSYHFEIKNYTVQLTDDSPEAVEISSSSASGTGQLLDGALVMTYPFTDKIFPPKITLFGGYLLNLNELEDAQLRNLPIHLFTNQEYSHIYVGVGGSYAFEVADTVAGVDLEFRYFLVSDYSESTEDGSGIVSGTSAEAGTGYMGELGFYWCFTEHFVAKLKYTYMLEQADFTGTGTRLIDTNLTQSFTDASVEDTNHIVMLSVKYDF